MLPLWHTHSIQEPQDAATGAFSACQQEDVSDPPATKSHWVTFMPSKALTIMIAAGKGGSLSKTLCRDVHAWRHQG